jgi:serine/threonine protein phosphatase PrpC
MDSAQFSLTGPKGRNQDSLLPPLLVNGAVIAAVADGVGGHADGQFASETAIKAIVSFFEREPQGPLASAFQFARNRLIEAASQFPLSRSMATTLSLVRIVEQTAELGHVGDSRVYHLRGTGLVSRTVDQTEVAELVRQNVFSPEEALRYPRRNVLLSSLSVDTQFDFFSTSFEVRDGDGIVLCTDGLYNTVKKADFIESYRSTSTAEEFTASVEELAKKRGTRDDATLITMRL